ncbi:MAG: response regulator [Ignavibacterium sp.]|jgi:DNA-binding NtrC family response regulator|uniref:Response regulator n=1 Tax=Ignavibacterium album TaxID=591197 RepID=A0A7V2ZMV3_9BACT|nr:response regulator [Ignavibacterium album]MCA2004305.1 response regulator [Ignavibacterium sp.]MCX8106514.1 response regulator [Ignavibacterium album]
MENILIVDDDVNLCKVLSEELSEVGYQVNYVNNGFEALDFLRKNSVDLMLLDLKMPGIDGFEVLKEMEFRNLKAKVIVLTAYADVKSAIDSAKMGANDFLSKPYDFDELLITIRKVLQKE